MLLVSEDLDEILELSDRIVVMFDGKLVYETDAATRRRRRHRPRNGGALNMAGANPESPMVIPCAFQTVRP